MIQLTSYMHMSGKLLEFQTYSYAKYRKYMVLSIQFCCVKQDSMRKNLINATFNSWNFEYSERLTTLHLRMSGITKALLNSNLSDPIIVRYNAIMIWPKIGVF